MAPSSEAFRRGRVARAEEEESSGSASEGSRPESLSTVERRLTEVTVGEKAKLRTEPVSRDKKAETSTEGGTLKEGNKMRALTHNRENYVRGAKRSRSGMTGLARC